MLVDDFNFLDSHSTQISKLTAIMFIYEPTHPSINGSPASLLDLFVVVSNRLCLISCQTIPALSNSDHLGLSISVSVGGLSSRHMHTINKQWTIWKYSSYSWPTATNASHMQKKTKLNVIAEH